jgi:DNA (cytosine-5)-methyltransferase 1
MWCPATVTENPIPTRNKRANCAGGSREFVGISLFSGCGGSSLGYKQAGFSIRYANEFIKEAADSYEANFPGTYVDRRDIRKVNPDDIRQIIGDAELDLLDGSPPCSAFSHSGNKQRSWNKVKRYSSTKQRVDDLFFEYIRILKSLQPRIFVAENVAALTHGRNKGYFLDIINDLRAAGYKVKAAKLNAMYYGVPQFRERTIFVGVREDLGLEPTHPRPRTTPMPLKTAFEGLNAPVEPETHQNLPQETIDLWNRTARGKYDVEHFNFRRCAWNIPAHTLVAAAGDPWAKSIMHPDECRKFSIGEMKRICGFPDDFILTGTYTQQAERLGRAVPPPMMRSLAEHLRHQILERLP